ncbi:MAG: hypothetical protein AB7S68_41070 [Polyangiaceae bacterium]
MNPLRLCFVAPVLAACAAPAPSTEDTDARSKVEARLKQLEENVASNGKRIAGLERELSSVKERFKHTPTVVAFDRTTPLKSQETGPESLSLLDVCGERICFGGRGGNLTARGDATEELGLAQASCASSMVAVQEAECPSGRKWVGLLGQNGKDAKPCVANDNRKYYALCGPE